MIRALLLAALGWAGAAQAEGLLWKVQGARSHHWIVGSVHLLPASALPLPQDLEAVYRESRELVFETDLDALAAAPLQAKMAAAAQGVAGQSPELAEALRTKLQRRAAALALPVPACAGYRTWFCAALLETTAALRAGFAAEHGVDAHWFARARAEGKPRHFLETPEQQLDVLAGMPEPLAQQLLQATLDEGDGDEPGDLLRIWKDGDLKALERIERELRQRHPGVHARVLADRNRAWLGALRALFAADSPRLVVVGALHMAGEDGLPALLWKQGLATVRMADPSSLPPRHPPAGPQPPRSPVRKNP